MTTPLGSAQPKHFVVPGVRARRPIRLGVSLAIAVPAFLGAAAAWRTWSRPDPDRVWREAEADLRAGRWVRARAGLHQLERLRAATPEDWLLRAQVANAAGDDDAALAALGHVPEDHPLAAQAAFIAGRIERSHHRIRRAEAAYRQALARDPGLIPAHKELIYILGMQLRRREVDAEFQALARLTPLTHHDLYTWGLTHFIVWGPDIAEDLEAFIRADPDDRYSRLALATLLVDQPGMATQAERALEPLPRDDLDAMALRVELKLNQGRVDEALAMLRTAPERNAHLARLRGRVALMRGDHAAAIRQFQEALSDEPYDRVSSAELGKALRLGGDPSAAAGYLARAQGLDEVYNRITRISRPDRANQPSDLLQLGRACEAAGLRDEARGWYSLAIDRNPLDAEAQQALYRLGAGRRQ
jgi:tetratricopeptide (TPR) repeat protein